MGKENNIFDLDAYLKKGAKTIYYVYASISCLGYSIDIINFYNTSTRLFYNNLLTISTTLICFLLYFFKKINLKVSFGIILYAALANVIIDSFSDPFSPNRAYFFLRDSLFIVFVITLASLLVKKIHAVIVSAIFAVIAIALTVLTNNSFLQSSVSLIVLFITVYAMVVYYFVTIIEKSILERERNNQAILAKNKIVNETNALLEERQQQIEEQSEELAQQAEVLKNQSEQLTLKNEELMKSNKTKNLFLSIMAHDLKNPFNVILGFAEILEARFDKLDNETKLEYIKTISSTSQKTFNLLENLLQWARAQSNTIEFKPKKIAINALLKENIYFFLENHRNKKIEITQAISNDCFAHADENMMNTTIRNLMSNAIKFTPVGGNIRIACRKENDWVIVDISDTGIGIDQDELSHLFQIDKTYSTIGTAGETGTGLGLILCKEFVEKNGGKIKVTSEKDKGSTFTFSLPATN